MTVHYRQQGQAIIVFGNTFPVKDRIKALGGRFNGGEKNWRVPLADGVLDQIAELCAALGGGAVAAAGAAAVLEADALLAGAVASSGATSDGRTADADPPAGLTIRQLMDRAAAAVSAAFPAPVWVVGEVQNVARRASGVFFDLAEGQAAAGAGHQNGTLTARAIVWSGALTAIRKARGDERIAEILQDGMQVRVLCQVQLYRDRGQVSLAVEDIDPTYTRGALALAREKLLRELRQKGLDQANKRRTLTPFPFRVGLVSAEGSRAASDFLDQLRTLGFPGEVVFCPTPMQGEAVPGRVSAALQALVRARCDLIVLTRGGGSAADLRWFDAPEIAYAIAHCPLPVVAAIGHHDDVAVAEEICYLRQKTPTAAADFVVGWFAATRETVDRMATTLAQLLQRRIDEFSHLQAALGERLAAAGRQSLEARAARLQQRAHRLHSSALERVHQITGRLLSGALPALARAADQALAVRRERLAALEGRLAQRDPKPWLAQGWTRLFGPRGQVARAGDAMPGDLLGARLIDGKLTLEVKASHIFDREKDV